MALVLVFCVLLVIGAFGMALLTLSRSSTREVQVLRNHMTTVAVGEAVLAQLTARLASAPWSTRWFKTAPDIQFGLPSPTGLGSYEYLIRDAQPPTVTADPLTNAALFPASQADLVVRASYEDSRVTMYWRLSVARDSLDGLRRVVPAFFMFAPDGTGVTPADVDSLTPQVVALIQKRQQNQPTFGNLLPPLARATTAGDIQTVLSFQPSAPVVDEVTFATGAPRPNAAYISGALSGAVPMSLGPALTAPLPAGQVVGIPGTVDQFLAALGPLKERLIKIQCYFGTAGFAETVQGGDGVGTGRRAGNVLQSMGQMERRALNVTPGTSATNAQQKLIEDGENIVQQAQTRLGYDPINLPSCP